MSGVGWGEVGGLTDAVVVFASATFDISGFADAFATLGTTILDMSGFRKARLKRGWR